MIEEAIQILREKDSFAAIEFLSGLPDAVAPSTLSDRAVFPPLPVLRERDGVRVFSKCHGSPPSPQPARGQSPNPLASPGVPGEGETSSAPAPHVLTAARAFDETMRKLYWKQKDLDGSIAIGRAGVQFALAPATPLVPTRPFSEGSPNRFLTTSPRSPGQVGTNQELLLRDRTSQLVSMPPRPTSAWPPNWTKDHSP